MTPTDCSQEMTEHGRNTKLVLFLETGRTMMIDFVSKTPDVLAELSLDAEQTRIPPDNLLSLSLSLEVKFASWSDDSPSFNWLPPLLFFFFDGCVSQKISCTFHLVLASAWRTD